MRFTLPLLLLALAVLFSSLPPSTAVARPEFARRELKACGFCHINPRGGGSRNANGLEYARNEFKFPVKKGDLTSFKLGRERDAMIHSRKMVDIQHIPAAVKALSRLAKSVKIDSARKLVNEELHGLDVKGTEILGQARRLLRSKDSKDRAEGVELLVLLTVEYKNLDVVKEAKVDLKELKSDRAYRDLIKKEQREAKARLLYLDGVRDRAVGKKTKADRIFAKVAKNYDGTRAAKLARKEIKSSSGS